MDYSKYLFRASQSSKLTTGTIGLTAIQKTEMIGWVTRKASAALGEKDDKDRPIRALTSTQEGNLQEYIIKDKLKIMPKTLKTEVRKIYRATKHKRNFTFTNKYVQKGLQQEDEAISVYQDFRENIQNKKTQFIKNTKRFFGEYFTGLPDLFDYLKADIRKEGFDTKCSWSLDTFPFPEDKLDDIYECQNQVYMDITGLNKWTTAYVLVNCNESQLHNEKLKHWYALMSPSEGDRYWDEYVSKCRDVEKMLIFDYERFVKLYPGHDLTIPKDEWFGEEFDIPLLEKVVEFVSYRDEEKIKFLNERATIGRKYLLELEEAYINLYLKK